MTSNLSYVISSIQIGIRDVFEPRQRDFTPMTPQAGVYVRSIEQAVSVSIRKYRPDDHKKNRKFNNISLDAVLTHYQYLYTLGPCRSGVIRLITDNARGYLR